MIRADLGDDGAATTNDLRMVVGIQLHLQLVGLQGLEHRGRVKTRALQFGSVHNIFYCNSYQMMDSIGFDYRDIKRLSLFKSI